MRQTSGTSYRLLTFLGLIWVYVDRLRRNLGPSGRGAQAERLTNRPRVTPSCFVSPTNCHDEPRPKAVSLLASAALTKLST